MKRLFIAMLVLAFSFTVLAQEKKGTTTAPTVKDEKTQMKHDAQTMPGQKEMKGGAKEMHKEMKEMKSHGSHAHKEMHKEMKEKHAKKDARMSTKPEMKKEPTKNPEKK